MIKSNEKSFSFSFCLLAYNHENYILEHLESIKFLVDNYAKDINVNLVINDDCSIDNTVKLIEGWLFFNENIFDSVVKLYNKKNLGTCKSVINILENVNTDFAKFTAGDDVYSYENIFDLSELLKEGAIVSGFPLDLRNNIISEKKDDIKMIISSFFIYRNKKIIERFKWPSNNNAPNIIYDLNMMKSSGVIDYLRKFDVVEDWPIQIALSENYPNDKFIITKKVFTYYRRTLGSTYIVAGSRFYNDQSKIYKDLISNESNLFKFFLLKNRLFCLNISNKYLKKILNLNIYIYIFKYLCNIKEINKYYEDLDLRVEDHFMHYKKIQMLSSRIREKINF